MCCIVLACNVLYNMLLCCIALQCVVSSSLVPHCMVWYVLVGLG